MYGLGGFIDRVLIATQGRSSCHRLAVSLVEGKRGLEIGGPSEVFHGWYRPLRLYNKVGSLDNCDFSRTTPWSSHSDSFQFSRFRRPGRIIVCDGSNLAGVENGSYDFVLSSHNLEHFANPVKALKEWQRVLRPGGSLILVLPHYEKTFDHRRRLTSVSPYDRRLREKYGGRRPVAPGRNPERPRSENGPSGGHRGRSPSTLPAQLPEPLPSPSRF